MKTVKATEKDLEWYMQQLLGNECLCGREKREKNAFCYRCYRALPPEMQKALYRSMYDGYDEAFEEAHRYLTENVW
jgi:hypothetical protein